MPRPAAGTRVFGAVVITVIAGIVGVAAVIVVPWSHEPRVQATSVWAAVLLALSCVGELAYVRMRHGTTFEDLTFYESVVVASVLLLPPIVATVVPLVALLAASAILRRSRVKTLFNLGNYAASTSAMVAIYTALGGDAIAFSLQSVIAVLIAAIAFAAVNLLALAMVMCATEQAKLSPFLRAEWRLSALMAIGNVALGAVAVELTMRSPALLPFALLPACTLGYAYRMAAHGADERNRTRHLVTLGGLLAGGDSPQQILIGVAKTVEAAFDASMVRVLIPARSWIAAVPEDAVEPAEHVDVIEVDGGDEVGVVQLQLALAPRSGAAGSRPWRGKPRRLGDSERTLLTSIVQMLASAVGTAMHAQALREETAKLTSVVESASDGIVVVDGKGTIVLWSPALEQITGRSHDAVLGRHLHGHDPLTTLAQAFGATVVEALPPVDLTKGLHPEQPCAAVQLTIERPDGEERRLRASVSAIFGVDAVLQKMVAIVHDITADERLARLKQDFVATVSHELRTPITPIKGYARLLATRGDAMAAEQRSRALRVIEERADHLSKLVDDLLLASKMSEGGLSGVAVDLGEHDVVALVHEAIGSLSAVASRAVLDMPTSPLIARCDPTRLNQCLTNILTNAQKYSRAGTPIGVRVAAEENDVIIAVTDQGRGIPADELERIFQRFHRVEDAMTMTTDGTGLGLFITRELARVMGGDVSVVSELSVGSCFTLHLRGRLASASAA